MERLVKSEELSLDPLESERRTDFDSSLDDVAGDLLATEGQRVRHKAVYYSLDLGR